MSYDYLQLMDRFETGQPMEKDHWDVDQVALTTRELVRKYRLAWNKEVMIPDDPDLADRVSRLGWSWPAGWVFTRCPLGVS